MAAVGEKIAVSIVADMLKKLSSYPEKKIIGIWKLEQEFQKLKRTFGMLLATLTVAEKQQDNNELVNDWLERLKDVADEADNVLGEFSFEAARMGIDSSKMEKVRNLFSNKGAFNFRFKMDDKIAKIYMKLDDIGKDMERCKYVLGGVNIDHSENDRGPMITSSVIEDLYFFGRENEKSKLIYMLIGCSSSNEETLSVVSIVGIGGLGKTTLARTVYNHHSIVENFQKRMWVWVSHDFEIRKLREGMLQSLTGVKTQSSETDEVVQEKLVENIGGKKILLVLDNVWNVDIEEGWEKLRALLKTGDKGSKIIVTTRFTRVASIIRTHPKGPKPLHLEGLSEKESWSLFKKRAFAVGGARKNSNTKRIGKELVQKCKGVPLAIKSLGAMMHSKTTDLEWESIQFSEIWKLEGQDNISSVLKLSYHDMPPPVKRCFTYCSIFPKGHKIVKKTLIQMWMAEGLLQSSSEDKLKGVGLEYFKFLLWICFLQDVERDIFGEEESCKMHDLVHDLAQSIIGNECRIVEDFDNKDKLKVDEETRYVSVVGRCNKITPEKFNNMEKVRAYLYLGGSSYYAGQFLHIPAQMFSKIKNLRVLDLTDAGIESLPSSIDKLKQLRYLDVSKNKFATFPKSITNLYNLQTLKMLDAPFDSILPKGIIKMVNLRHLEVELMDYPGLRFPKGIGQLTNLQTLLEFSAAKDTEAAGIEELRDLRQLGGSLNLILSSQTIKSAADAANLKEKPRLRELQLTFLSDDERDRQPPLENDFHSDNKLLESLQPHPSLISLEIFGFRGSEPPTWLDGSGTSHPSLLFLQYLKLDGCSSIKSFSLTGLCSLRWLVVEACPNLCLRLGEGLTALKHIKIKLGCCVGRDELITQESSGYVGGEEHITVEGDELITQESSGYVGGEEHITVEGDELITQESSGYVGGDEHITITPSGCVEGDKCACIIQLSAVRIARCSLSCRRCWEQCSAVFAFSPNIISLKTLKIHRCHNIATLPDGFFSFLTSLNTLEVRECEILRTLPESMGNLSSLQNFTLQLCKSLAALPESMGNLSSLQNLTLEFCKSLAALPESFGSLSALQNLTIMCCGSLAALPESFGSLSALQNLTLQDSNIESESLAALPESFGSLSALQNLIVESGNLAALPKSFGSLSALQILSIEYCGSLATLPESFGSLSALQNLNILNCGSLAALPESFGSLSALQNLNIVNCGSLAALPESFGSLSALQNLTIICSGSLAALPESFGSLSALQNLNILNCGSLAALPESFGSLSALRDLIIRNCDSLAALPESFGSLSALQNLSIDICGSLLALPESFGSLSALQNLTIEFCGSLAALPESFGSLSALQELSIKFCGSLAALPESFGSLLALQNLSIEFCGSLAALPESFGSLSALQNLDIEFCGSLAALPESFGSLPALQNLILVSCESLAALPESFGSLSDLELKIWNCRSLPPALPRKLPKFRGWPRSISHSPRIGFYGSAFVSED